jgi:hypothetical protein
MISEDPKIISSDDQKRSWFRRMDAQEGACTRIDYDDAHRVAVSDQICVRNCVEMIKMSVVEQSLR